MTNYRALDNGQLNRAIASAKYGYTEFKERWQSIVDSDGAYDSPRLIGTQAGIGWYPIEDYANDVNAALRLWDGTDGVLEVVYNLYNKTWDIGANWHDKKGIPFDQLAREIALAWLLYAENKKTPE